MTTTQDDKARELRVMFSARKDPALVMGRTLPQLVFLVLSGVFVVLFLRNLPSGGPNWWLLGLAVALAPVGWLRIRGRGVADVGPALLADAGLRLVRQREFRGGPHRRTGTDTALTPRDQPRMPGALKSLELFGFLVGGDAEERGVVFDRSDGTVAVVMQVTGKTYPLLDSSEANAYALGFQRMQDGLARRGSPVVGIQCLERVIPDLGEDALREWQRRGGRGARFSRSANQRLLQSEAGRGIEHQSLIVVRVDPRRARAQVKEFGGGDEGRAALALKVSAGLQKDLEASGVQVLGWLPPRGIAAAVRSALDPAAEGMLARRGGGLGDDGGGDAGLPSGASPVSMEPMSVMPARSYVWHEDHVSRTWWIEEYPRSTSGVHVGFLQPLLLEVPWRHSVSILLQPLERRQAQRQITEQASTASATDKLDKKMGRRKTRAKERQEADMDRREIELVEGFANYRIITLVTATARNVQELELVSADIEAAINSCSMEGHIWYVETDQALYMGALPLGRGLL
ncbi:MAG: SCO6880 family protein [Nakamurella sp.]